ncbi:MAG: hypothetical protein BWY59_01176 [Verrucomicrobia bacterium ADurb.Bin345]|nr:MAG: hypothetical protein BWY59_01176 [Verrucomicrobia bacterium ADurb.Bin345]
MSRESHASTRGIRPVLAFAFLLAATAYQLHRQGRIVWCACGSPFLWDGDIWSSHNSQHLFDPYSFTHVLHGVLFCGLVCWLLPRVRRVWQLWIVTAIEAVWEIVENTPFVIQRYREATIGLGYEGDSIANSAGDLLCCALGFFLALKLGLRKSAILFVVVELALLLTVRDNLTLNVLMLLCPIEAIKSWQMGQ